MSSLSSRTESLSDWELNLNDDDDDDDVCDSSDGDDDGLPRKSVPLDAKVMKEIHHLMTDIDRLTDGQAKISGEDDTFNQLCVEITASEGYYKGETHTFKLTLDGSYPICAPDTQCTSTIFHPNIDMNAVCVNILDDWCPAVGLAGVVTALVFILHNPNYDDPLSTDFIGVKCKKDFAKRLHCLKNGISYESGVHKQLVVFRLRHIFRALCCCCRR